MSDAESQGPDPAGRDAALRELVGAGCLADAATVAIERHGPELLGYLFAVARNGTEAEELFGDLCERIWRGLADFRWDSSFRTWAYTIARNLLRDRQRALAGPRGRVVPISDASAVKRVAESVRSSTALHLKTEAKTRLQQVRERLDPDDRTLLILRIDRRLPWRDIAAIMRDEEADDLAREAARLRKRFERLKERLRAELAGDDGSTTA